MYKMIEQLLNETETIKNLGIIGNIASILGLLGLISIVCLLYNYVRKKRIKNFILKNYVKYDYNYDQMFPEAVVKFKCSDLEFTTLYEELKFKNKLPKK
jgi:hypothetical protein